MAATKGFPDLLRLNDESDRSLSSLTPDRLESSFKEADYRRVVNVGEAVVAFLLAWRRQETAVASIGFNVVRA
ncbi:MAG: hypothetical protein KBA96_04630 [Rhodocyclaceae bacterium]|nr:hypothetical protein [Rhodocyclaceae bacterium]